MSFQKQFEDHSALLWDSVEVGFHFHHYIICKGCKGYTGTHLSAALAKKWAWVWGVGGANSKKLGLCMFYKTNIRAKLRHGKE